ncbi:hypothetical protein [Spirillospora sp. NPDC048819]|uniref:hypothetical protein n=1 Tax=Spirillospora sp. NPDC048819 TaxID=3155268 RepID=UPI0033D94C61
MAESPPRSDTQDSASGDDLNPPQVVEDGDVPRRARGAPEPWGGSRPWWSADSGDGTGPHPMPGPANRSGAHPIPGGTGPHGVLRDGTGPQVVISDGTGGHPVVTGGSGAHPVMPGGSGAHPIIPGGTGPLPAVPGQARPPGAPATAGRRRIPRFLLVTGAATVAAGVLMVGVLAFRMDGGGTGGGGKKDARTTGVPASGKVIVAGAVAGGLRKDALTAPQASAAYPFVAAAVQAAGVPVAKGGRGVYGEETAGPVNVLFMGGTGPVGNPETFLQKVQPTTFIAGQDADPGRKGGKAVCGTFAVLADTHTFCAWATRDSFGIVASNRPTLSPQFPLMADVMRRIRNDVEKPR